VWLWKTLKFLVLPSSLHAEFVSEHWSVAVSVLLQVASTLTSVITHD
jgi:hypothetical protein